MKKFMIGCLISGFVFIAIGVITVITSVSMGVTEHIKDSFNEASESYEMVYAEYETATGLDFELEGSNVEVSEGVVFSIRYPKYKNSDFQSYIDADGTWHIEGALHNTKFSLASMFFNLIYDEEDKIYITVPEGTVFTGIDISADAGKVVCNDISAKTLSIDADAGNVEINSINISDKIEIDCSAGNVEIDGATASELYINLDMGNIDWSGDVSGDINAECNMGNITIELFSSIKDYNYSATSNMGNITLNGNEYAGFSESVNVQNGAGKNIVLHTNMGNIDIIVIE